VSFVSESLPQPLKTRLEEVLRGYFCGVYLDTCHSSPLITRES
jgi:hypothetical protein